MNTTYKIKNRVKRKQHIRKLLNGSSARPRVTVFRSNKHITVQAINDDLKLTIASSTDLEVEKKNLKGVDKAKETGHLLAKKLAESGIKSIVFDRNGYKYHGRVKSIAEGMRESGINF